MTDKKQEVRKPTSTGSWKLIVPVSGQPVPAFVSFSESRQYNLLTDAEYKTEQRAVLALALLTRPTQLTYQERQQLLALLGSKGE